MNYQQLLSLFKETHQELQHKAARSVDTALVIHNWLFQGGSDRAEYGTNLLKKIATQLKPKGCSERSLALCCKFYLTYSGILQAVPAKSESEHELQKIQQTLPVTSFDTIANAPQIVYQLSIIS
jgi:predicted ATP-grasp superfamily ATP-dependent carboligase